jgi:DNA-binding SARP family transcriptional activator
MQSSDVQTESEAIPMSSVPSSGVQSALQLRVMGTPSVRLAGRELHFKTRKALAMLLYLALEGPQAQGKLTDLLWPGAVGSGSLRTAALHLRSALEDEAWRLQTSWCGLSLDLSGAWLDVQDIKVLDLRGALDARPGEFMAGLYLRGNAAWDDYLLRRGEELRADFDARLEGLAAGALGRGEAGLALALATRRQELDAYSLDACCQLQSAIQAAGQGHKAAALAQAFRERFEREFGPLSGEELLRLGLPEHSPAPARRWSLPTFGNAGQLSLA